MSMGMNLFVIIMIVTVVIKLLIKVLPIVMVMPVELSHSMVLSAQYL